EVTLDVEKGRAGNVSLQVELASTTRLAELPPAVDELVEHASDSSQAITNEAPSRPGPSRNVVRSGVCSDRSSSPTTLSTRNARGGSAFRTCTSRSSCGLLNRCRDWHRLRLGLRAVDMRDTQMHV